MKKVIGVFNYGSKHWVGNGFHVRNFISSNELDKELDPFLLLDYAGPSVFMPSNERRGVTEHPHRGFETVTIVFSGHIIHRDSQGNQGKIGPGDVQWMTAASGIVHEELHDTSFTEKGGTLEMIQLWINLPKVNKMSKPRYQTLSKNKIPIVQISQKGYIRVIAGIFGKNNGPAKTFSPINLFDIYLPAQDELKLTLPNTHNTGLFIRSGNIKINQSSSISEVQLAVFDKSGTDIFLKAEVDSQLLVLNGKAINEPIARYGPFVMNTKEEIQQALNDYRNGLMGRLTK